MNIIFWVSSAWLLVSAFSVVSVEQTIENGVESQIIRRDALLMFTILAVVGLAAILFYTNLYRAGERLHSQLGMAQRRRMARLGEQTHCVLFFRGLPPGHVENRRRECPGICWSTRHGIHSLAQLARSQKMHRTVEPFRVGPRKTDEIEMKSK
jgi:hypothetical protein